MTKRADRRSLPDDIDARIEAASHWLLGPRHTGIIGELKARFGLSPLQAVAAIRLASEKRRRAP